MLLRFLTLAVVASALYGCVTPAPTSGSADPRESQSPPQSDFIERVIDRQRR